jgi:hypothetical protein
MTAMRRRGQHKGTTTMSMLRPIAMAGALLLAALVGGTVIPGALAATATPTTTAAPAPAEPEPGPVTADAAGEYCAAFKAALATNLNVSGEQLTAAVKAAIGAAVDDAVADGSLPAAAAERIKTKVAAADGSQCGLLAGWRAKVARGALQIGKDVRDAAADALDITAKQLRTDLRAGKSLENIATASGVPYEAVQAAAAAAVRTDLDAAVAAGTITQARADRIMARVTTRLDAGWPAPTRTR